MKRKFKFWVETRYVNSKVEDTVALEFDDKATEEEIESVVEECWSEWRNEQCNGGWYES